MPKITTPDGREIYVPDGFKAPPMAPADEWDDMGGQAPRWSMEQGWHNPATGAPAFPVSVHPDKALEDNLAMQAQASKIAKGLLGEKGAFHFNEGMNDYMQGTGRVAFDKQQAEYDKIQGTGPYAPQGRAFIAQATGPVGTIGQIGQPFPGMTGGVAVPDVSTLSRDLATHDRRNAPQATTAEGKIAQGEAEQRGALEGQQDTARAMGGVESGEMAEVARLEQEGQTARDRVSAQMAEEQARYQKGLADKQQAVSSAVKNELEFKVDENRRWKNMSTGKTLMFWISAALSGLGDALQHKNGPNMALQMMNSAIEQDIDLQLKERDQLGKRIGTARSSLDEYVRITGGDLKDARALKIAEEQERLASQLRQTAAKYGSEKAKLRAEAGALQFEQSAAALKAQAGESMFHRDLQRDQQAIARGQLAVSQQNTRIAGGHLALANRKQKFDEKTTEKQLLLQAAGLDQAGDKAAAEAKAKAAEDERKYGVPLPPVAVVGPDGKPTGQAQSPGVMVLKNADEKEAPLVKAKVIETNRIMQITDELRQLVADSSGAGRKASAWLGSPEQKRMNVLKEEIVGLRKKGTTGMSSDADMARLERAAGVNSLNDLRGASAALDEAREQTVKTLHETIRGYGGDPTRYQYIDPMQHRPATTPEEQTFANVLIGQGSGYEGGEALRKRYISDLVAKATDKTLSEQDRAAALDKIEQGVKGATNSKARAAFQGALTIVRPKAKKPDPKRLDTTFK